jgi:hypothetical protein
MSDAVPHEKTRRPITAETPIDRAFFQPVARFVAEIALGTPLPARGLTALSAFVGLAGASLFRFTSRFYVVIGAVLLLLYAVLARAAVQLARARGTASRSDRILGGIAAYAVGLAASFAMWSQIAASGNASAGLLTFLGMGSVALQVTLFDHYEKRYLAHSDAEPLEESDLAETRAEIATLVDEGDSGAEVLLLRLHTGFLIVQRLLGGPARPAPRTAEQARAYAEELAPIARAWAWLGSSTHVLLLVALACLGALPVYLWLRITAGNAAMIALWIEQQRRERAVLPEPG